MQTRWHELRKAWADEGFPSSSQAKKAFDFHDDKLCQYIWDTTQAAIAEDRRKHPKAKRNQPVPTDSSPTRHLP